MPETKKYIINILLLFFFSSLAFSSYGRIRSYSGITKSGSGRLHISLSLGDSTFILGATEGNTHTIMTSIISNGNVRYEKDTLIFSDTRNGYRSKLLIQDSNLIFLNTFPFLLNDTVKRINWYTGDEDEVEVDYHDEEVSWLITSKNSSDSLLAVVKRKGFGEQQRELKYTIYDDYAKLHFDLQDKKYTYEMEQNVISTGTYEIKGEYLLLHDQNCATIFYMHIDDTNSLAAINLPLQPFNIKFMAIK